jgi:multicomponent K+:H+ antiporter subunit E
MKALCKALPLAVALLLLWRVLNESLSAGQWLTGFILALILSLLAPLLRPVRARVRRPGTALRLAGHVARDIAVSNAAVALRILRGDAAGARPGFLDIPLRLRDPHGLAALSCIVTFTPGTVWAGHDTLRNVLTLHVLDLNGAAGLARVIQERYERPLMEIFE